MELLEPLPLLLVWDSFAGSPPSDQVIFVPWFPVDWKRSMCIVGNNRKTGFLEVFRNLVDPAVANDERVSIISYYCNDIESLAAENKEVRNYSLGGRPEPTEIACQLGMGVICTRCGLGEFGKPVTLDPLQVSTWFFSIINDLGRLQMVMQLTEHGVQIVHYNLHCIVPDNSHEVAQMHHVVSSLELLRQRLEYVQLRQRNVLAIPGLRGVLFI